MIRSSRLLIVGDSIPLGITHMVAEEVREISTRNFVDQLRRRLPLWQIDVDAAAHRTSSHAVELFPALLRKFQPNVVLFFLGGSDADINWKRFILTGGQRVRHNTPVNQFESNLRRLALVALQAGVTPIIAALPDQDLLERGRQLTAITGRDVVSLMQANGGQPESDRRSAEYAAVIDRVAGENGTLIARWDRRIKLLPNADRYGRDAIHPSDRAHDVIAEVVGDLLEQSMPLTVPQPLTAAQL